MNKNNILVAGGGILGILIFVGVAYFLTSKPQPESFPQLTEVKATDHTKWAEESSNILVEYSDLQCPACGSYAALIQSLSNDEEFNQQVKPNITFVYRHFPLDNIHPHARAAAYAAEAAGNQGAFFEMHDLLFANQQEWSDSGNPQELFNNYAQELELDTEQFVADIDSEEIKNKVQDDYRSGLEVNVQGTPTFYLNGKKLNNIGSPEAFKQTLLNEIQAEG